MGEKVALSRKLRGSYSAMEIRSQKGWVPLLSLLSADNLTWDNYIPEKYVKNMHLCKYAFNISVVMTSNAPTGQTWFKHKTLVSKTLWPSNE